MSTGGATKPWEHVQGEGSAGDPLAARFVASLDYDQRLYRHDIRGSLAHAAMLHKVGLISDQDHAEIQRGLAQIEQEIDQQGRDWPGWKLELEDVHMCIEAALIEKTGDAGRKLHTGRSRNDQVALDLKLWIEEACDHLQQQLKTVIAALVDLANRQGRMVMPGYTHLQRAQPIVLGGELLAWAEAFERCSRRLTAIRVILPRNPLGSGAIAGSSLPLDRDVTAQLLPLGQPTGNSIEATASRDAALDFTHALAMTAMWLSRWAEQWILYATSEFGFITLDRRYTTGSSMMPQKQNPDMLELIRGRCGSIYGHQVALMTLCKGLTIGYNRDLQEDKRHVFAAYDTVNDCLAMTSRIIGTTAFNEPRIRQGLDQGFLDATSLAEYLVTQGVPFRTSHQMVGRLVHACRQRGHDRLSQLAVADMRTIADTQAIGDDVYDWLGAENVVQRYRTRGNAGLSGFEQELKVWQSRLAQ